MQDDLETLLEIRIRELDKRMNNTALNPKELMQLSQAIAAVAHTLQIIKN